MGGVPAQRVKAHIYIGDQPFEASAPDVPFSTEGLFSGRPLTPFEKRVAYTNLFLPHRSRDELLNRSALYAVTRG